MAPPGMEEMAEQMKGLFSQMGGSAAQGAQAEDRRGAASCWPTRRPAKLVNDDEIKARALANAENNGIVFIDEIDKIATPLAR